LNGLASKWLVNSTANPLAADDTLRQHALKGSTQRR
jgi:hypothetical protein